MSLGRRTIGVSAKFAAFLLFGSSAIAAMAQDVPRQTVAVAYPLDENDRRQISRHDVAAAIERRSKSQTLKPAWHARRIEY